MKKSTQIGLFYVPGLVRSSIFIIIVCTFLFFSITSWAASVFQETEKQKDTVVINIFQNAEVKAGEVFLRDVATVDANNELAETLGAIRIAKSPAPGMKRFISGEKVVSVIRSSKCLQREPKIKKPEFIKIHRSFQVLSEETIKKQLYKYIDTYIDGVEYQLDKIKLHRKNRFPVGNMKLAVNRHNSNQLVGLVKFILSVTVEGNDSDLITVSAWINRYETVVFTKHSLHRGTLITKDDLCLKSVNVSRTPRTIVKKTEDVIGKILKQNLRAGIYLRENMLERPPMINKGDRVKIIAGKGLLQVTAKGVAKTDGFKNEQIRVQNINSKRIIVGRVMNESTVRVKF